MSVNHSTHDDVQNQHEDTSDNQVPQQQQNQDSQIESGNAPVETVNEAEANKEQDTIGDSPSP